MSIDELREALVWLKDRGEVKEYHDAPRFRITAGDFLMTYASDRTILGLQPTLAVSRVDQQKIIYATRKDDNVAYSFSFPADFVETVTDVFGVPDFISARTNPGRGETVFFTWSIARTNARSPEAPCT